MPALSTGRSGHRAVAAAAIVTSVGLLSVAEAAPNAAVVDLEPRAGVTLRYLALAPEAAARAAVILFTGGQGVANIPDVPDRDWASRGSFLVRSRELFRARGLFVAIIDAPSDHKGAGGLGPFRIAPQHAADVAAVVADVRRRSPGVPVWLVGTSRGTISAANAAARLKPPQAADGLVLTSTLTAKAPGRNPPPGVKETVHDVDLGAVRVPTLIVYHRDDACYRTPPDDVPALQRKLTGAPHTAVIAVDGGDQPRSDSCEALAAHGFFGREAETVEAIVDWITRDRP